MMLENLYDNKPGVVVYFMAFMNESNQGIIRLKKKLSVMLVSAGIKKTADLLCLVNRTTKKSIIDTLESLDEELAEKIKNAMFEFDDIVMLDSRAIQSIMSETYTNDLKLALKNAKPQIQELFINNMSKRAAIMFKEDLDCLKILSDKEIEEARENIIKVIRHLEDCGHIVPVNSNEEELIN